MAKMEKVASRKNSLRPNRTNSNLRKKKYRKEVCLSLAIHFVLLLGKNISYTCGWCWYHVVFNFGNGPVLALICLKMFGMSNLF